MKLYKYDDTKLQFKQINYAPKLIKAIVITFTIFAFMGVNTAEPNVEYITDVEEVLLVEEENQFTEEKLIEEIKRLNFKYPHIVLAQAKLETGNYTSRIFKENHNLFGMKEAKVRLNLAEGTQYSHAYYNDWEDSIMDYALWYASYARKCKNEKQLYKLLDKQYAEASYYVETLQSMVLKENLKEKFNHE